MNSPRPGTSQVLPFLAFILLACGVRAEIPPLLKDAFARSVDKEGRWAYTETTSVRAKVDRDEQAEATIVRFDPSKPYPEQYTPLLVKGRPPTERDLKKYRRQGEKRQAELEKAAARLPREKLSVGDKIDLDRIAVTEENATSMTYSVPVRKGSKIDGVAVDKFELLIRVNKDRRAIENLTLRLREAMRVKVVANIRAGQFSVDFTQVDPALPPVMTKMQGNVDLTLFFLKKISADIDESRTDYKRVTPYDDRFQVEVGPLRVLNL